MEFFSTLGKRVGNIWKRRNYDERCFAEIAMQALTTWCPSEHVSMWDVLRWCMRSDNLPAQADIDANFGDPPLTVYVGHGFRIEVLFWVRGVPAIHQHSFSGAFHVLQGSSIHSRWTFTPAVRVQTGLLLGDVQFRCAEMLRRGESRPILAGDRMYHATFHLDRPSISIVVRTMAEDDMRPQYTLLPPSIARVDQIQVPTVQRQVQIMRMLISCRRRAEFQESARHVLATKDATTVYEVLTSTYCAIEDQDDRHELLLLARSAQPTLMQALEPALIAMEARQALLRIHQAIGSADLKWIVALLLNVPDRNAILQLIAESRGGLAPAEMAAYGVRRLFDNRNFDLALSSAFPRLLKHLLENGAGEIAIHECVALVRELKLSCSELDVRALLTACQTSWALSSLFREVSKAPRSSGGSRNSAE